MPKASGSKEQVENRRKACIQVLFLHKAKLGFFTFEFLIHSMFNLHHVLFKLMKNNLNF